MILPFSLRSGYGKDLWPRIIIIVEDDSDELEEDDDDEEDEDEEEEELDSESDADEDILFVCWARLGDLLLMLFD